jgi:hypothetical protein
MEVASALLSNAFRFVRFSVVVFTIAFVVPPLSGEEIDPRDYIGEDISKYPPHLRQKIERAFLRQTGERFTGSQYDPRSPDYAFEKRPTQTIYEDEESPAERYNTSSSLSGLEHLKSRNSEFRFFQNRGVGFL